MKNLKEVDWDKAPSGATHYNKECSCPWLKETPPSFYNSEDWVEYTQDNYEDHFSNAVKRPEEIKNKEWSGEGVPPVGTVCEYSLTGGEWFKCKIMYTLSGSDDCFVAWCDYLGMDQYLTFSSERYKLQLRKIKTPEQVAEEERLQAIGEMLSSVDRYSTLKGIMCALYNAGYRKT